MAATVFSNGSYLNPTFMNHIFGTSGHVHSGQDADGSAPLVDLTAHVTGVLPMANMNLSTGSWDLHFVGGEFTTNPDLTLNYIMYSVPGHTTHWVWVYSDGVNGTAGTTTTLSKSSVINIMPEATVTFPCLAYNNGSTVPGVVQIDAAGTFSVRWYNYTNGSYNTGFATSGTKGVYSFNGLYISLF